MSGTNLPTTPAQKAFLEKIGAISKRVDQSKIAAALKKEPPKLLFSMDATQSREATWDIAQDLTRTMFDQMPGGLKIALAYHGGGRLKEVSEFRTDLEYFKRKVAEVRCDAGQTALCPILEKATQENGLSALIYIGDAYEEGEYRTLARDLKLKKVPCFFFLEGNDPAAKRAFSEIAEITGGAVFPFEMTSLGKAKDRLDAIAAFAAGGTQLLKEKAASLPAASELLKLLP